MCEHNTSVVIYAGADTTVEICEWGCDRILVHKILPSGTSQLVREVEHPQVAALREEVERLRGIVREVNSMNNMANLNDAELWNVNSEFQERIEAALK